MTKVLKPAAHLLLFAVAIVVFFVGLGIGLAANPTIGTVLWLTAGALIAVNLVWLFRSRS